MVNDEARQMLLEALGLILSDPVALAMLLLHWC